METVFKQARKIKRVLREFLKIRWAFSWDNAVMVMDIFQNVLGHLNKSEASLMAVKVVQKLWHFFDAVRLMWEPEPCRGALGNDSCPAAQPCEQCWEQALLPGVSWDGFQALQPRTASACSGLGPCSITPHLSNLSLAPAGCRQRDVCEAQFSSFLPEGRVCTGALHLPLQIHAEKNVVERQVCHEEIRMEGPGLPPPPHE